jgi:hypothetical protein
VDVPRTLKFPPGWKWFHATRAIGILLLAYGVLVDHTPERGSIILGGLGLLGLEKVARTESGDSDKNKEGSKPKDSS